MGKKKKDTSSPSIAVNRKARHDYFIEETLEAGIVLEGSEVKSLRFQGGNIKDSYAGNKNGELVVFGLYIPEFKSASHFNHEPLRIKKLLVHKKQRDRLFGLVKRERMTIVPLRLYFNTRGIAKLELGLAKGKRQVDKRQTVKERDWKKQKARLLKDKG